MLDDRRVHARGKDGLEVVRYDRAGKWYLENPRPGSLIPRRHVKISEAAKMARLLQKDGGTVFFKIPGGGRFDLLVRQN